MVQRKYVPVRLSEREIEKLKQITLDIGATNRSEAIRYCIVFTHASIKKTGKKNVK